MLSGRSNEDLGDKNTILVIGDSSSHVANGTQPVVIHGATVDHANMGKIAAGQLSSTDDTIGKGTGQILEAVATAATVAIESGAISLGTNTQVEKATVGALAGDDRGAAVVSKLEATDALMEGVKNDNIAETKAENWTMVSSKKGSPNNTNVQQLEQKQGVVNRSSNKRSSEVKEQATTPKNIEFSNSFDALRNDQEHVMNKEGKSIQQVLMDKPILDDIATTTQQRHREAASKSGRPKSPESPEQQIFSQHTGAASAIDVHRKTWAERVQEEEEYYADSIHDDSDDEAAQFSATPPSKDEEGKVQSEQVSNSTYSRPKRRGLSPNAPAFVPSKQQQIVATLEGVSSAIQAVKEVAKSGQQRALSAAVLSSMYNVDATGSSSAMVSKYNLTPTNILHALVSHDIDTLRALHNPRHGQGALVRD
ncbi:hypothetical protein A4A49_25587 [Nicotiana attenuata]|uniref:Uncharacterized protein n=1 Tax=Nicotiana attenuata TaxID=49451 RepID=A0A314L3D8_NICAT|nr:hypothetical protein A4A49_25587 [Nicotiana attenuata]